MAQMGEIQHRGAVDDIKGVMNYVYQLEEQIRYVLANLGSDNLAPGSVDVAQLGPNVTNQFTTIINGVDDLETYTRKKVSTIQDEFGNYSTTMQTEEFVGTYVTNALGDYSTTLQTAQAISSYVTNALGDYSTTQQTAQAISSYVTNALGDYSTTQQTAQAISQYVANNAYTQVSGITITSAGIEITGSQYVKIGTNGKLIVTSGNVQIDQNGNAKIGGFSVTNGYIGASEDGVYMARNVVENGTLTNAGGVRVTRYGTSDFTLWAGTDGRVLVNGYNLANGWIKLASVSGNTLTLTKHDGTTVNFSKAAVSRLTIEAAATNSAFKAVAYDSSSTILGYANGEIYLDNQPANYSRSTWACVRQAGGSRIAYVALSGYWDAAQAAAGGGAAIGDIDFEDRNGSVYAKVYDTNGNLLATSGKYLTNSFDSINFTRNTKRVIKKWSANGSLLANIAEGSLATYWDAAQAAV